MSDMFDTKNDGKTASLLDSALKLGPYAAENGKPDVILIARLFAEDVLFFPEQPFERKDNKLTLSPQFNKMMQGEHPFIAQHSRTFFLALMDLFVQLDTSEELYIPKNSLHQKILKPLLDDRLTGLSFLNLMAYHMVKIVEKDNENTYLVVIDRNVIAGIPDAYHYVCKFIKFARNYNEKRGAFAVYFSSAINLDSPISGKLIPVSGAIAGRTVSDICGFTVQEDGTITDGDKTIIETEQRSFDIQLGTRPPRPKEEMTNEQLEAKLDKNVIIGIRCYTKEAFIAYKKIPIELRAGSFSHLRSTNGVIARVSDMMSLGITNYCLQNVLEVSYWEDAVQFEGGTLTYNIRIRYEDGKVGDGSFDPNQIPNELIAISQRLTEDEIYHTLLINAVKACDSGKTLIVPNVYDKDEIEVVGTQYEGRSARIEGVKVGDKLILIREPSNIYDKNAIDVQNVTGSLGHLPSHIANRLSPAIDMGLITCTATVSEVLPLSKRGARAKKAILKVRLNYDLVERTKACPSR